MFKHPELLLGCLILLLTRSDHHRHALTMQCICVYTVTQYKAVQVEAHRPVGPCRNEPLATGQGGRHDMTNIVEAYASMACGNICRQLKPAVHHYLL